MIINGNIISTVLKSIVLFAIASCFLACQSAQEQDSEVSEEALEEQNPPAEGFDMVNSHPVAMEIADQVMEAMGGRTAWDNTMYISWDFFGARKLIWDKMTGNVRIEFPDNTVYLVNIHDGSGKALKNGEEVINPDSLARELDRARSIWINDSYWLLMPFKLKDSGVTLKHLGTDTTLEGTQSHVLELTFKEVGVTPQNRYLVYIDTTTNLVNQWAYFREAAQDSASFVLPWGDYREYGQILLSDDRGERSLSEIKVYESLPEEVFTSLDPVDLSGYN